MMALQDAQLLTEQQDLDIFVAVGAAGELGDSEQVKEQRDELSD